MRKNITVIAIMNATAEVVPLSIIWTDGRKFDIDKVIDKRKQASTRGGGKGLRYECEIMGKRKFLWLDDYIWFLEIENSIE